MKNSTTKSKKIALPRIINYSIGLILISFGMTNFLTVRMGMTPLSSLPVTIYEALNIFTAGRWITIIHILFVIATIITTKKINIPIGLSFITIVITGFLVDFFEMLMSSIVFDGLVLSIFIILGSSIIIAFGISFLLLSDYPPMPDLFLMKEIEKRHNFPVGKSKIILDVSSVLIASIISIFVLKEFVHIGIGTIISALLLGPLVNKVKPIVNKYFKNASSRSFDKAQEYFDYNLLEAFIKSK